MKLDADNIWMTLWQGSLPPVGDAISKLKFDRLVLTAEEHQDASLYKGVKVWCLPTEDSESLDAFQATITARLALAKEVAVAVKNGEKVLVTCFAGLNRSGFITALALHYLTGWSGDECVKHIQSRRDHALCNDLFSAWLKENVKAVL